MRLVRSATQTPTQRAQEQRCGDCSRQHPCSRPTCSGPTVGHVPPMQPNIAIPVQEQENGGTGVSVMPQGLIPTNQPPKHCEYCNKEMPGKYHLRICESCRKKSVTQLIAYRKSLPPQTGPVWPNTTFPIRKTGSGMIPILPQKIVHNCAKDQGSWRIKK